MDPITLTIGWAIVGVVVGLFFLFAIKPPGKREINFVNLLLFILISAGLGPIVIPVIVAIILPGKK